MRFSDALVRRILDTEAESRQLYRLHGWTYQPGFWPWGMFAPSAREAGYSDRNGNARRLAWKACRSSTVQRELSRRFREAGARHWVRWVNRL